MFWVSDLISVLSLKTCVSHLTATLSNVFTIFLPSRSSLLEICWNKTNSKERIWQVSTHWLFLSSFESIWERVSLSYGFVMFKLMVSCSLCTSLRCLHPLLLSYIVHSVAYSADGEFRVFRFAFLECTDTFGSLNCCTLPPFVRKTDLFRTF